MDSNNVTYENHKHQIHKRHLLSYSQGKVNEIAAEFANRELI
jgi:hypothetical protein